jgi:hypothetical protein
MAPQVSDRKFIQDHQPLVVAPANAGVQGVRSDLGPWISAFAGMTGGVWVVIGIFGLLRTPDGTSSALDRDNQKIDKLTS